VAHGRSRLAKPYPWFDYDNEAGMRMAVERLAGFGHRDIALVSAPLYMNFATQRREGFMQGLQAAGLEPLPQHLVIGGLSPEQGREAMAALLASSPRPSAVVVDNNVAAVGVLQSLRRAGLVPGRDIALLVFGNMPEQDGEASTVSAVVQPEPRKAGRTMAELMLARLNGRPAEELQALWQPLLVAGDTDGQLQSLV
jgi:LacI family transcriptional regulator